MAPRHLGHYSLFQAEIHLLDIPANAISSPTYYEVQLRAEQFLLISRTGLHGTLLAPVSEDL